MHWAARVDVSISARTEGGLELGHPRNQVTNIPNLYAIGECDYQFHGANRLGANSLLSCIFSGLIVAPGIQNLLRSQSRAAAELSGTIFQQAQAKHQQQHDELLRKSDGRENPYLIHQELGDVLTKAATVVRRNDQLREAIVKVEELCERANRCGLADSGNWTNQNVIFTKALKDMFPIAKTILEGAVRRDECRGAHYKPDFAMPSLKSENREDRLKEAEQWCDRFEENNAKWLKSTVASWNGSGPEIQYEDVDTSIIPPRPRLYGLVGAEVIEEVWKRRLSQRQVEESDNGGNGATAAAAKASAANP